MSSLADQASRTMTDDSPWPPKAYRTRAEADAWLPRAREIVDGIKQRVPSDRISIDDQTLFVGTLVPELVGCVAVALVGIPCQMTALTFDIDGDLDATVALHVRRLLEWRARVDAEQAAEPRAPRDQPGG